MPLEITRSVKEGKSGRTRSRRPIVESLEGRLVLSTMSALHLHAANAPVIGAISGQVVQVPSGTPLKHVKIELIDSAGKIVSTQYTDASGDYSFGVRANGAYVVHEVVPNDFAQIKPSFSTTAPSGTYLPGYGATSWTYVGTNTDPSKGPVAPAGWSTITNANLDFGSPINIKGPATDLSKYLTINYTSSVPKAIINNGHQIQVQLPTTAPDTISVAGTTFTLSQFHYHDTSENVINGKHYAMEQHFVNVSANGGETVVAVFLKVGAHNNALDPVLNAALAKLGAPGSKTTISTPIDFTGLLPTSLKGWFYTGSLTTPPLSLPVNWFVLQQPITLDLSQLQEYQQVASAGGFLPNNRPVQPTDGRLLNSIDHNVNFQNQSIAGMNFDVSKVSLSKVG